MSTSSKKLQQANHYINGRWISGEGNQFYSHTPTSNDVIWEGLIATPGEAKQAVQAASQALPAWSSLTWEERANYLIAFSKEVEIKRQELAYLISLETGKPLWEAHTEVSAVVSKIHLSIQAYQERTSEKKSIKDETHSFVRYKPHGVIAVLGAFNFPAHLSNGHIIPALLAGNTVILKPSELTPAVAQWIIECWHESGLPAGVINCIQGDSETGKALLALDIQGVYFTGSYRTGQLINQSFASRPEVILALEMGGNNPLIIDENIQDMDAAIYCTLLSTMITSGQRCSCARRIFIPNNAMGHEFLDRYIQVCQKIKIGSFNEHPEPFMGPVISHKNALKHIQSQKQLIKLGGKSILTMHLLTKNTGFLSPGIIDMTGVREPLDEEIFAPLVQVFRYDSFEAALEKANKTSYGLVAGLISDNEHRYNHFYKHIKAGLINWNRPTTGASGNLPFGGIGWSGNHRPSGYFAADYCAYPVASLEKPILTNPKPLLPGIYLT